MPFAKRTPPICAAPRKDRIICATGCDIRILAPPNHTAKSGSRYGNRNEKPRMSAAREAEGRLRKATVQKTNQGDATTHGNNDRQV
jgi:hypothetical protein